MCTRITLQSCKLSSTTKSRFIRSSGSLLNFQVSLAIDDNVVFSSLSIMKVCAHYVSPYFKPNLFLHLSLTTTLTHIIQEFESHFIWPWVWIHRLFCDFDSNECINCGDDMFWMNINVSYTYLGPYLTHVDINDCVCN